jgi:hypothetical protein
MNYYVFIQSGEPAKQKPLHHSRLTLAKFSHWKHPYAAIVAPHTEVTMEQICKWAKGDGLRGFVFRITYNRMVQVDNLPGASCKLFDIPTMRQYSDYLCAV